MAYLTPQELQTHLYGEQIEAISRQDESLVLNAIDAAVMEAKGYLMTFDTDRIFSAEGAERNALLLFYVKDIAVWHFIVICNAGTQIEYRQGRYNRAISWLRDVQKGAFTPDLPKPDLNGDGKPDTHNLFVSGSNPKRKNQY